MPSHHSFESTWTSLLFAFCSSSAVLDSTTMPPSLGPVQLVVYDGASTIEFNSSDLVMSPDVDCSLMANRFIGSVIPSTASPFAPSSATQHAAPRQCQVNSLTIPTDRRQSSSHIKPLKLYALPSFFSVCPPPLLLRHTALILSSLT
jgi:hypothetical protein